MLIFILFPVLLVVLYSITPLNTGNNLTIYTIKFTLEHYKRFFVSMDYVISLYNSFKLAMFATIFTLILGYPIAYILANMKGKTRNLLLFLMIIPMWTNMLLRTYAWQYIIGRNGLINVLIEKVNPLLPFVIPKLEIMYTKPAVILGMTYNYLPFMILPIFSVLVKLDKDVLNAAYDLGANKFWAFIKVTLPLSIPGVVSGVTMVFLPAATSFIIPSYLGGGKEVLIGNIIEMQFKGAANNPNYGSALSIILMIIIFGFTGLFSLASKDESKGESLW